MNICHVLAGNVNQIGGLEKHVLSLCEGLAELHEVTLVAHPKIRKYLSEKVMFVPLDLSKGRLNLGNLCKLFELVGGNRFDIVHAHANKACFMLALLKMFFSFRLVASLHGQKKKLWAYSRADHVIAVSQKIAAKVKNPNSTVIYHGSSVQAETLSLRDICEIEHDGFLFCAVGRMTKVKGFDFLVRAFADVPARLVIIGDGPERSRLEKAVADLEIQGKVFFPGFLENASGFIWQADAVVISSLREGFSYVFLEALLSRTPVISTDVADVNLLIGPEYVTATGDSRDLREKMKYIIEKGDSVGADFAPVFDFAARELVFSAMLEKVCKVYESVVEI